MSSEGRGRSALAPHRSIHKVVNRISACMGLLGLLSLRSGGPTNSSQSDTLQVKSQILVKQTDWCYILGYPEPPIGTQVKHILIILSLV